MDKFVVREPKKKDPHLAVHKSAKDRAAQYPGVFHADNGLLFCSSCNVVLDHLRKSILDKHLDSSSHKKKANQADGKQQTIKTAFECKTRPQVEKVKVSEEWIKACTAANIPLHKSDNPIMRKFLDTRVVNGGAIPKASQLRDYYLFDVYQVEKDKLKKKIEDKNVALIVDELSDDEGRYVLDVMVVILNFDELSSSGHTVAYLLDTHFLSATNNKTVSQAVVKTVHDYNIEFNNVRVFNSDNVGYMKKAFNDTLSCLFPLCVHITCNSHVVNLVASDFKKGFKEVNEFVKCFRNLFFIPSGRKSRFLTFLRNALGQEDGVKMPPNPNTKSWGAWFESVLYHAEYYLLFEGFIKEELDRGRSVACSSLLRLEEMYSDHGFMKKLGAHLSFLKVKSPTIKIYMDFFQQKVPHITEAHNKMESLLYYLEKNTHLSEEDLAFCFERNTFTCEERKELVLLANSAFSSAREKLQKYVVAGAQPALKFLRQIHFLDPRNLVFVDCTFDANDSIPGFDEVSRSEWDLYVNRLGPEAVKGKAPLLEQDIVLVPLNPGVSKHWSLLVVKPKEKEMFVLDSLAASFVKPSTKNAILKMRDLLQEIDPKLDPEEWHFSTNTPQDIPQQSNSYDCGAFVCAYARCLLLKSSLPGDFTSFRKHMVLELHGSKIQGFDELPTPQEGKYYAIEYQKSLFYIGRALQTSDESRAEYKFLHKCSAQLFDWPKRDDVDTCHDSCVFYGPVSVVGNAPFSIPQLVEIEQVFNWLRKSRKTKK